jgi:hypothetical protein
MIQKDEISNGVYQQNSGCHYKAYEVGCVQLFKNAK